MRDRRYPVPRPTSVPLHIILVGRGNPRPRSAARASCEAVVNAIENSVDAVHYVAGARPREGLQYPSPRRWNQGVVWHLKVRRLTTVLDLAHTVNF